MMDKTTKTYEMSLDKFIEKIHELKNTPNYDDYLPEYYGYTPLEWGKDGLYINSYVNGQVKIVPGKENEAYKLAVQNTLQAHFEGVMNKGRMLTGEHLRIDSKDTSLYVEMLDSRPDFGERVLGVKSNPRDSSYLITGNDINISKYLSEVVNDFKITYHDWQPVINMNVAPETWVTPINLKNFLKEHMNTPLPSAYLPQDMLKKEVTFYRTIGNSGVELVLREPGQKKPDHQVAKLNIQRDDRLATKNVKLINGINLENQLNVPMAKMEYGTVPYKTLMTGEELSYRNISRLYHAQLKKAGYTFAAFEHNDGTFNIAFKHKDTEKINQITKPKHLMKERIYQYSR